MLLFAHSLAQSSPVLKRYLSSSFLCFFAGVGHLRQRIFTMLSEGNQVDVLLEEFALKSAE
jgi:hypothetical protein